jgi:hypothetical protein
VSGSQGGGATRTRPARVPSHAGARRVAPIHAPCMCMSVRGLARAWGEGACTPVPLGQGQRGRGRAPTPAMSGGSGMWGHGGEGACAHGGRGGEVWTWGRGKGGMCAWLARGAWAQGACAQGGSGPDPAWLHAPSSRFWACAPGVACAQGGGPVSHAPRHREWEARGRVPGGLVPGGACAPGGGMGGRPPRVLALGDRGHGGHAPLAVLALGAGDARLWHVRGGPFPQARGKWGGSDKQNGVYFSTPLWRAFRRTDIAGVVCLLSCHITHSAPPTPRPAGWAVQSSRGRRRAQW